MVLSSVGNDAVCWVLSWRRNIVTRLAKSTMHLHHQISIPLARVSNLSLKEGVVPFEWKEANIVSLFKKGSRNKSENYRPVSLRSVICKFLERLIKDLSYEERLKYCG